MILVVNDIRENLNTIKKILYDSYDNDQFTFSKFFSNDGILDVLLVFIYKN
jgi:hypothetical protein